MVLFTHSIDYLLKLERFPVLETLSQLIVQLDRLDSSEDLLDPQTEEGKGTPHEHEEDSLARQNAKEEVVEEQEEQQKRAHVYLRVQVVGLQVLNVH